MGMVICQNEVKLHTDW